MAADTFVSLGGDDNDASVAGASTSRNAVFTAPPAIPTVRQPAILAIRPSALPAGAGVQIITMTNLSRIGVRLVSTSQGCTGS